MTINLWETVQRVSWWFVMTFCTLGMVLDITGGTFEHAFYFALVMFLWNMFAGNPYR